MSLQSESLRFESSARAASSGLTRGTGRRCMLRRAPGLGFRKPERARNVGHVPEPADAGDIDEAERASPTNIWNPIGRRVREDVDKRTMDTLEP